MNGSGEPHMSQVDEQHTNTTKDSFVPVELVEPLSDYGCEIDETQSEIAPSRD